MLSEPNRRAVAIIKLAQATDAAAIVRLTSQLGYDVTAEQVVAGLDRRGDSCEVYVATDGDAVIGWIALGVEDPFVAGRGCRIEGLVVDEKHRSEGIGAELLAQAETWCRQKGLTEVRVHSNVIRDRAHPFYERNGYTRIKSQHYFTKTLRT